MNEVLYFGIVGMIILAVVGAYWLDRPRKGPTEDCCDSCGREMPESAEVMSCERCLDRVERLLRLCKDCAEKAKGVCPNCKGHSLESLHDIGRRQSKAHFADLAREDREKVKPFLSALAHTRVCLKCGRFLVIDGKGTTECPCSLTQHEEGSEA